MTSRAAQEPRIRLAASPWAALKRPGILAAAAAAALAAAALFGGLWWLTRPAPPPVARAAAFPAPPELDARIAAAQDRLKEDPEDVAALTELGTLLFQKGKDSYVEAIGDLEQARDLGALDPRIFYCLGVMYQEEGLYPFALTEYKRFLRNYPDDKEVRLLAGKLDYAMGRFPEALGEFERLHFSYPGDPIIEENLALSLRGAKQTERAQAAFERLRGYGGDYARRADFYLGEMALENRRYKEALDLFQAAGLDAGPLPEVAPQASWTAWAIAQQKMEHWAQAKAAWQAALKAAPGDAKARTALRQVEHRLAAEQRAAARAKRAAARAQRAAARAARRRRGR